MVQPVVKRYTDFYPSSNLLIYRRLSLPNLYKDIAFPFMTVNEYNALIHVLKVIDLALLVGKYSIGLVKVFKNEKCLEKTLMGGKCLWTKAQTYTGLFSFWKLNPMMCKKA